MVWGFPPDYGTLQWATPHPQSSSLKVMVVGTPGAPWVLEEGAGPLVEAAVVGGVVIEKTQNQGTLYMYDFLLWTI